LLPTAPPLIDVSLASEVALSLPFAELLVPVKVVILRWHLFLLSSFMVWPSV
jgi:hypothetical protein